MKVGRKHSADRLYADELGVSLRAVKKLGGSAKLRALEPEARALLLHIARGCKKVCMRDIGMQSRVPGRYRVNE